jgi:hypothetical protein
LVPHAWWTARGVRAPASIAASTFRSETPLHVQTYIRTSLVALA